MKLSFILSSVLLLLVYGCISPQQITNESNTSAPPQLPIQLCNDSDGGLNVSVNGSVVFNKALFRDVCQDEDSVLEYYCQQDAANSKVIDCAGMICINGKCTEKLTPDNQSQVAPPSPCQETDLQDDVWVAGSVSFDGSTYSDVCQGTFDLLEYYCDSDKLKQKTLNCGIGNKCESGACVPLNRTCADPDSQNDSQAGTVTQYGGGAVISTNEDTCVTEEMRTEYYCEGGLVKSKEEPCSQGTYCSNGVCMSNCQDGDAGLNYAIASSSIDRFSTSTDFCADETTLVEYYCDGDAVQSTQYICSGRCYSGKCLANSQLSCKEYSGGSTVRLLYNTQSIEEKNDSCTDYSTVTDYKCISNKIEYLYKSCDDDEVCLDGSCQMITTPSCYDLDADTPEGDIHVQSYAVKTTNDSIADTKQDECFTNTILTEFSCNGIYFKADQITCPTEERCVNGACVYSYTCSDSDGGQSLQPGETSLMEDGSVVRKEHDACADDTTVHEVYCTNDYRIAYALLKCPDGTECDSEDGSCK